MLIAVSTRRNHSRSTQSWGKKNNPVKENSHIDLETSKQIQVFHPSRRGYLIFNRHRMFHHPNPAILLINYSAESPNSPANLNLSNISFQSLEPYFNVIAQIDSTCLLDYCTLGLPLDSKALMPKYNLFSLVISWDCCAKGPRRLNLLGFS